MWRVRPLLVAPPHSFKESIMKAIKLNVVPVHFDAEAHTYTHRETGEALQGITHVLREKICPDEYKNISEEVLQAAAERGHKIHSAIEMCDTLDVTSPLPECKSYQQIKGENGFRTIENEYLVTDGTRYASCIDLVWANEADEIVLADIKTTYRLDREYVSWQLSVYAYLFEKCNPRKKVKHIYALWLRDEKSELAELQRKTKKEVEAVLYDEDFRAVKEIPSYVTSVAQRLIDIDATIRSLMEEEAKIKDELQVQMRADKSKSWDTGRVLVTLRKESKRTSFDSTRFKSEHSDLYGQYLKETITPEVLTIKVRPEAGCD